MYSSRSVLRGSAAVLDAAVPAQMPGPLTGLASPQRFVAAMYGTWVALATAGEHGRPRSGPGQRAAMRSGATCEVVDDRRAAVCGLWEAVW